MRPPLCDDWLYEADSVAVGLLLFTPKVCARCGEKLPGCSDYFGRDRTKSDGLTNACRSCRRKANRGWYAGLSEEARTERLRHGWQVEKERRAGR